MRVIPALLFVLLTACGTAPKHAVDQADIPLVAPEAQARVEAWKSLIAAGRQWNDMRRLNAVNDFVNRFHFIDDIDHWGQEDYWATPLQTVVTNGGDCEDFSIAKYFTLTAMGMNEDKLRLTYVKALSLNQAHMVVSYYERPTAEPLVLDNLDPRIRPASQRDDLLPVYSFNGSGLWLSKREGPERYVDSAARLGLWQQLLRTMAAESSAEPAKICLYQYHALPETEAQQRCN